MFQIRQNLWRQWVFNNRRTINMIFNILRCIPCSRTDSFVRWIDQRMMCCWIISRFRETSVRLIHVLSKCIKTSSIQFRYANGVWKERTIAHPAVSIHYNWFTELRNPISLYTLFSMSINVCILHTHLNPPCCQSVFVINLTIYHT